MNKPTGSRGFVSRRVWTATSTMDAQRSLFGAQQRWLELELAREINQVNLFKALGVAGHQGRRQSWAVLRKSHAVGLGGSCVSPGRA